MTYNEIISLNYDSFTVADDNISYKNDILKINAVPGPESFNDEIDLEMFWSVKYWRSDSIKIDLNFTNSDLVSSTYGNDILEVQFISDEYFRDVNDQPIEESSKYFTITLPNMNNNALASASTEALVENANLAITCFNIVSGASLQYLWDLISSAQIIILFPIFSVDEIPESTKIVFNLMLKVASFELIPTDVIYEALFNSDRVEVFQIEKFAE